MALNIHTSHRMVFLLPAGIYLVLVLLIAILPAMQAERDEASIEEFPLTPAAAWGRDVYRKRFNCVVCHTQQVREDSRTRKLIDGSTPVLQADARFGLEGPTTAAEYAHQEAPLLGTQRTGPDLSSIGLRQPGTQWHYWHLYNPRSVSPDSTMEAYPFLFTAEKPKAERGIEPQEVLIIDGLGFEGETLWATPEAVALVDYLLSLRRELAEGPR